MRQVERVTVPDDVREAELTRLMETYGDALAGLCTALTRDADLAQDIVQETFLRAYRNLDRYRGGQEKEKAWLTSIAVNLYRDLRRSRWFRWVDRGVDLDSLPEPSVPARQEDWQVYDAVQALPDRLREVVILRYHQDLDAAEIAKLLGTTRASVYRRLNKAYELLRQQLEEADNDD